MRQLGSATRTLVIRGRLTEDKLPAISSYFSSFGKVLSVDFSRVLLFFIIITEITAVVVMIMVIGMATPV